MVEDPDKANGYSTLEPYQRRRRLERQIDNQTADDFGKARDRGELLAKIRELFKTADYSYVMDFLRVKGYKLRTRKELIRDAIGSEELEDTRSDLEKQEARMLGKVRR